MRSHRLILLAAALLALGYVWLRGGFDGLQPASAQTAQAPASSKGLATATFAAGCFWCTEADFDKVPGVVSTTSGYTGGTTKNPTYQQVSAGVTGHAEAVEIAYDPSKVTYEQLLDHYWKNVDPLTPDRQFCDVGSQYRPAIFYHDEAQKRAADASKARVQKQFKEPVVVQIVPAGPFYRAEEYHQDYYKHNEVRYKYYRFGCGRDRRLQLLWSNDRTSSNK
jgi:peptide-methionine (S)-S-oxide reductase